MPEFEKKAVVLLSGGVDSSTCLVVARHQGFACYALSICYGQRNSLELQSASRLAQAHGVVEHRIQQLDLGWIGGSALTSALDMPKSADGITPAFSPGVPITYVPARNSLFLTLGTAWAETLETDHIFIGVNQVDYSGYPDCRPDFIQAMQNALRLGTRRGEMTIHTPLVDLSKAEIVQWGTELGLDYGMTWSCYDPQDGMHCGLCDSCIHRRKGFREAKLSDPTVYANPRVR